MSSDKHRDAQIKELLLDLFVTPRKLIEKWSKITNQTAQVRISYPGQHLASLIVGRLGSGTAARGDDLEDGTEVKTCSKADQLGECKDCGAKVLPFLKKCPSCGSTRLERKTDSHWIFPIQNEKELQTLLTVPRIILILFDRDSNDKIQVRVWRISPKDTYVRAFFKNYYYENHAAKVKRGEKPSPCNLHPLKFDFYMMNPVLLFHAKIIDSDITILSYDSENQNSEDMPISFLSEKELIEFLKKIPATEIKNRISSIGEEDAKKFSDYCKAPSHLFIENHAALFKVLFPVIDEEHRRLLGMREKKTKKYRETYFRKSYGGKK